MTAPAENPSLTVWARKDVAIETCPTSYITADSEALVEEYFVRRRLNGIEFSELSARQVEAFLILETAFAAEMSDDQHNARRDLQDI